MTIQEKIDEVKQNRVIQLLSKVGTEDSQTEANEQIDYFLNFITSSNNQGIIDMFKIYSDELNTILNGNEATFTSPNLALSQSTIQSDFKTALYDSVKTGGSDLLYTDIIAKDINESSSWLLDNGYTAGTFTLAGTLLYDAISLVSTKQLSLKTIRETQSGDPLEYINRDEYNNPEKTELENALSDLITSLSSYKIKLLITKSSLDNIHNGVYELYLDPDIRADVPIFGNEYSVVQSYIDDLQSAYDYLSLIIASDDCSSDLNYDRNTFDALIGFETTSGTLSTLLTTISNFFITRISTIEDEMGIFNITTGLRKWYYFWIKILLEKPQSPYTSLIGSEIAKDNSISQLLQSKEKLDIFLSNDTDQYLSTSEIASVYIDQEMKKQLAILSMPVYNSITIYRNEIELSDTLSNEQWSTFDYSFTKNVNNETVFEDESSLELNKIYLYRARITDTLIDTYSTSSLQSNVLQDETLFDNIINNTITFTESHSFYPGDSVYVSGLGLARVLSVTSLTIILQDNLADSSSGTLYRVKGILFT